MISEYTGDLVENSNSYAVYKTEELCFKCANNLTRTNTGLECEFCSHIYHIKCLNSKEYSDLDLNNIVLFICNSCQKNLDQ